jgi:hypothetical protein
MKSYPYTIANGHGEELTFTGVTHAPDGDRAEADGLAQPGAGPPMHVHYLQDEAAQVVTASSSSGQPARRTSGGMPATRSCA